jgi:hypothetical protein
MPAMARIARKQPTRHRPLWIRSPLASIRSNQKSWRNCRSPQRNTRPDRCGRRARDTVARRHRRRCELRRCTRRRLRECVCSIGRFRGNVPARLGLGQRQADALALLAETMLARGALDAIENLLSWFGPTDVHRRYQEMVGSSRSRARGRASACAGVGAICPEFCRGVASFQISGLSRAKRAGMQQRRWVA